jgi:hypothetical protein
MACVLTLPPLLVRTTGLFLSPEAAGRGEGQPLRPDAGRKQQLHAPKDWRQAAGEYAVLY